MIQILIDRRLSVAGTALLCWSAFAAAGAAEPADIDSSLGEVIVVATRAPVSAEKIGNSVTVVSDKALAQSQATVLSDLLATTPGVMVTRNGGPGAPTSVRIRGAEDTHTLVLIDGVQINDPASPSGGFDFGNLLVGDISRIEILRGSQSTVYGSQAIGGVVSVTTREPQGALGGDLQAEGGDFKTALFKAGVGAQFGQASFRVAGSLYRSDGVSAFAGGSETDPFVNATFAGRFSFDFTPDLKLDLRTFYADGKNHYDGFPPPAFVFADEGDYATTRQFVGYAGLNFNLLDGRLANRVAYQNTDTRRLTHLVTGNNDARTGGFDGKNRRVEYQGNIRIADGYDATVGLQHQDETMDSASAPTHASVGQKSAYALLQAEVIKGFTLTLGDRHDDHDTFGTHNTAQAAVAWALASKTVLRASWGQGFKAPTLYQLFSPYNNLALEPEQSNGWDAGIEQRFLDHRGMISATYFVRDTRNQIDFSSCSASLCAGAAHSRSGVYTNIARTRTTGVELQTSWSVLDKLDLSANYTRMEAENRSPGANFGKRLARRPDEAGNAAATYRWLPAFTTTAALRYTSDSFDDVGNTTHLGGYVLIDFRASLTMSNRLELYGRVENLTNRRYQTVYQYGTEGRAGYAGLRLKF